MFATYRNLFGST